MAFLAPEAVLFDDRHGEIHHLNPSASAVWLLIDGELSIEEIVDELSEIFGVPESELLPDVETIVEDFRTRGLLVGGETVPSDPGQLDRSDRSGESDEVAEPALRLETLARPPNP
jgi:hypothetical protein